MRCISRSTNSGNVVASHTAHIQSFSVSPIGRPAINAYVYSSTVSRTVVQASSEPSVASVSLVASVNANHGAVLTKADLAIAICIILSDDVGQLMVRDEHACVNPQRQLAPSVYSSQHERSA